MGECKYEIQYLSLFYEDLSEKLAYIENVLNNPQAARQLLEDVEQAIIERLPVSEFFEPYRSIKKRKNPFDLNHWIAMRPKLWYDF